MKGYWQDKEARLVWRWILFGLALLTLLIALVQTVVVSLMHISYGTGSHIYVYWGVLVTLALLSLMLLGAGRRIGWPRLVFGVIPTLLVVGWYLSLEYYSREGYVDITAGRRMVVYRGFGVPYKREVTESRFTQYYRQLVDEQLPNPIWWYDWSNDYGVVSGKVFADAFTSGVLHGAEVLAMVFEEYDPPDDMRRKLIGEYLGLAGRHETLGCTRTAYMMVRFAMTVRDTFEAQNGEVQLADLPAPDEFAREWLKERYGEDADQ